MSDEQQPDEDVDDSDSPSEQPTLRPQKASDASVDPDVPPRDSLPGNEDVTLSPGTLSPESLTGDTIHSEDATLAPLRASGGVDQALRQSFEQAWVNQQPRGIASCLPPEESESFLPTLVELVGIDLEFQWKQRSQTAEQETVRDDLSNPPLVEDYLKDFSDLNTPEIMLSLLQQEFWARARFSEEPEIEEYHERFPDFEINGASLTATDLALTVGSREEIERARSDDKRDGNQPDGSSERVKYFGEYELLQEIARGGMGVVYKARQSRLNRTVALKMILSGQLASEDDVQRFYIEAEAAASLEHPGIVPIFEIGEHEGQHFFSMGFIDGAGLDVQVKEGPMAPREAAALTQQVCEAIAYAHSQNVIHRDLKPANVLIDGTGQAKVTDFGLAKKTDGDSDLTGTGQILGTPAYMPPEQASGETDTIGPAADIYSLGAILYALLTGRPPFQSANVMDTLVAVLEQEPVAPRQLNPALDQDLETICLKCLQKDAARRYGTTDELVAELGRYLNGEPIHARPIGKLERTWRWCKRKPALAGLGALAAVMLLTLGIGGPLVAMQQSELRNEADAERQKAEQALSAQLQAELEHRVAQARSLRDATPQAAATILRELDLGSRQIQDTLRSQLSDNSLSPLEINRMRLGLLSVDAEQLEPIVEFVLSASGQRLKPEELLLIRDVLAPHGADVAARFLPSLKNASDRLRAGCFLAGFAADGDFWPDHAENLAADLVRVLPSELTAYRQALRPVRKHLIDPLSTVYRDASAGEQVRAFATDTLVDYLSEDAEGLSDLLADANEQQFSAVFDRLVTHPQPAVVSRLVAELDRELVFQWDDPPLPSDQVDPTADTANRLTQSGGLLQDRFAFCQTLPLADFEGLAADLSSAGYRPLRLRPFSHDGDVLVAAVWTRDGRDWRSETGLAAGNVTARDQAQREAGFVAVDIAGYIDSTGDEPSEHYAALWVRMQTDQEDSRLSAGAAGSDAIQTAYADLDKQGFKFRHTLQAFRGLDGQPKYSVVRTRRDLTGLGMFNTLVPDFEARDYLDRIHWDLDLSQAGVSSTTQELNTQRLAAAVRKLKTAPEDLSARFARGKAHFYLGNNAEALDDMSFVIEKAPKVSVAYQYRAVLHARLGNTEQARQDLAKYQELSSSASQAAYLDAVVSAHLQDAEAGMKRLEAFLQAHPDDGNAQYNAACAYSIASGVVRERDAALSETWSDRAVTLLKQAVSAGASDYGQMHTDPDLDPIRQSAGFQALMQAGHPNLRIAAVWNPVPGLESRESHGLSPVEHQARSRELAAEGFRMVSVSSASIDGQVVTASVWHRPLVSDDARETLAQRQANAAVAALRLGAGDHVWPLLQHSPDPSLRTWIIHRLSPQGASADQIVERLSVESDVSIRRALILILGEYPPDSVPDRQGLSEQLLKFYREDPDAGIHGAAGWVLRQWGHSEALAGIDKELATGQVEGDRQWYVTRTQQHTFSVLPGPVTFLMGSPLTEQDRVINESLHRRRIGHSFAISRTEVTVDQFQEFLRQSPGVRHGSTRRHAPDPSCPQISVAWYDAAAYCRWLSEQEGIAEDQMCYPPVSEIKPGLVLPSDYLTRTGYRLPSESEWVYACRGGTVTSRCYGRSAAILGEYGWFQSSSSNRTWPVGGLKPNGAGLFDMHGNVWEWCQERHVSYSSGARLSTTGSDTEDTTALSDTVSRVLRGGSFTGHSAYVRSALRTFYQPNTRASYFGFRPARTYHLFP